LLGWATEAGITGGAVYDALIAATAHHARATLLTRDSRATAIYEKLGISYELVL
jgi:predicted nucleic acid-binding protein